MGHDYLPAVSDIELYTVRGCSANHAEAFTERREPYETSFSALSLKCEADRLRLLLPETSGQFLYDAALVMDDMGVEWANYMTGISFNETESGLMITGQAVVMILHDEGASIATGEIMDFDSGGLCVPARSSFLFGMYEAGNAGLWRETDDLAGNRLGILRRAFYEASAQEALSRIPRQRAASTLGRGAVRS